MEGRCCQKFRNEMVLDHMKVIVILEDRKELLFPSCFDLLLPFCNIPNNYYIHLFCVCVLSSSLEFDLVGYHTKIYVSFVHWWDTFRCNCLISFICMVDKAISRNWRPRSEMQNWVLKLEDCNQRNFLIFRNGC